MRFSEFHRIGGNQTEYDFVDVPLDRDIKVFVDPYALAIGKTEWFEECHTLAADFFQTILSTLKSGNRDSAISLLSYLSEENRTRTGYSAQKPRGKGFGNSAAKPFLEALEASEAFKTGQIEDIEDIALFVDRVGYDIVSDMLIGVLREKLAEYTRDQCKWLGVPMETLDEFFAWHAGKGWHKVIVNLPIGGERSVLLLPRALVRRDLSLQPVRYLRYFMDRFDAGSSPSQGALAKMLQVPPVKKNGNLHRKAAMKVLKNKGSLKNVLSRLNALSPAALEEFKEQERQKRPILLPSEIEELQPELLDEDLVRNVAVTIQDRLNANIVGDIALSITGAAVNALYPLLQHPRRLQIHVQGCVGAVLANCGSKGILWESRRRGKGKERRNVLLLASSKTLDSDTINKMDQGSLMQNSDAGLIFVVGPSIAADVRSQRAKFLASGLVVATNRELFKVFGSGLEPNQVLKAIHALAA